MNICIKVPFIKDFSVEKATAQTLIKSDDIGFLNLNKEQAAEIIGKSEHWVWGVDDESNEGWVPKSMSKISKVIVPHLGVDVSFKITLTIKNQMQKLNFEQELEYYCCKDVGSFSGIEWTDKIFLVMESNHRVISTIKFGLEEFKEVKQKFYQVDLKNFKRSSAIILIQIAEENSESLENILLEQPSKNELPLISGEILRYTCAASGTCGQVYQTGKLSITNFRFLFTSGSKYDYIISVAHYAIENFIINIGQITIITKDLRTIDYFISQDHMRYVLDKHSELKGMHFCFDYHLAFNSSHDFGWTIYDPEREFTRMGAFDGNSYKKVTINNDYQLCESYPSLLFQPASVTKEELFTIASFRSKNRLPTVTWTNKTSALYRSSQPCVGVFYSRCKEDEEFMVKAGITYIVDARQKVSARANKVKGKGFEHSAYYSNCKIIFMNIPNIHKVRTSYEGLKNITTRDDFFLQLHNSKWLLYIRSILIAAKLVADFVVFQKKTVLVHCSDGWDRTSQITSLAQLLIDPFYRTFHGFQVLICKDWLSFGYKFKDRSGSSSDSSPIFIQFLDSVFQILRQIPNEFQFTNAYLLFLAQAVYSGKYGTFMANSEKDLKNYSENTISVWKEDSNEYFNANYCSSTAENFHISTQISNLVLWDYFYQWSIN